MFIYSISSRKEKSNTGKHSTLYISKIDFYFVCQNCKLNINKKQINNISKISEVTINKCFKKLESHKKNLIPKKILKNTIKIILNFKII